ncbi:MAG: hypothetical protein EA423_10420 [Phycisphaerales bacterium]|nr:MAG: hypothetical protein EA423_10420 [Phycisphaerales bacterium]
MSDQRPRVLHLLESPRAGGGGGAVGSLAACAFIRDSLPEFDHTPLLLGPTAWARQAADAGLGEGYGVAFSPDPIERVLGRIGLPRIWARRSAPAGAAVFDRVIAWSIGAAAWWRLRAPGSECFVLPMNRPLAEWSGLGLPAPIVTPAAPRRRAAPSGLGLVVGLIADPPDAGDARLAAWVGTLLESMGVHTTGVLSHRMGYKAEAVRLHRQLENTNGLLTPPGVLPALLVEMDAAVVQPVSEPIASVATLIGLARGLGVRTVVPSSMRRLLEITGGEDARLVAPGDTARDFAQTLADGCEPEPVDLSEPAAAFAEAVRSAVSARGRASA